MSKLALLIGINYEGTGSQLEGCRNDVANMEWYLKSKGYTDIVTLTDASENKNTAKFPNQANIKKAMNDIIAKAKEVSAEYVFIHYSGHGGYTVDLNKDEVDGRDECIYPLEYNGMLSTIVDDELKEILVNNLPASTKLRTVFDCCHSGTMMDLMYRYVPTQGMIKENDSKVRIYKDVVCISGCMDTQTSADAYINRKNQGALTAYLLELMKNPVPGWRYKDFIKVLQYKLHINGYEQIPQLTITRSSHVNTLLDL